MSRNDRKLRDLPVWSLPGPPSPLTPTSTPPRSPKYKRQPQTLEHESLLHPGSWRHCFCFCFCFWRPRDNMSSLRTAASAAIVAVAVFLASALRVHGVALVNPEGQSYSEQMNSDLQNIKECNRTFPIGLAAMNAVLVHQRLTGVGDENFQCFLHCLYTKYGWMDDEGSFLLGTVRTSLQNSELPPSAAQWLLYRCTSTSASDPCERALSFTRCFWSEAKEAPQHDEGFDFDQAFKQHLFNSRSRD